MDEKKSTSPASASATASVQDVSQIVLTPALERAYVRKMDIWLLPFLSLMYFFNSIDRSNLANAKTDGMTTDMHFVGEQYSLLVLLFYIPNGLFDLPLNLLTKHFSGRVMLPLLMTAWGAMALIQTACRSFASMLVVRLLLSIFEAGFFAGTVFYLTLFYTRGELAFRIALYFGSALLASAFSGVLAFGVFQIHSNIKGWMWLFIIEGGMTVVCGVVAFFWLPANPQTAWFLSEEQRAVATQRTLRDGSAEIGEALDWAACLATWRDWGWRFPVWCVVSFTYPVAFATTANFLPIVLQRLGYSTVKTNLMTVPPNVAGFLVLLAVTYNSDRCRERTFHIVGSLLLSLVGLIILAAVAEGNHAVAYFACFLLTSGAYIPSCLVHSWHNNNNLRETSRAATTGLFVGLGNLSGILSAATFRTQYAPRYAPTLIATACCNVVCIGCTLWLGLWMRAENRRRNRAQGVDVQADQVDTQQLSGSTKDPNFRYFV